MTEVGILPFVRCFKVDCGVKAAEESEIIIYLLCHLINSLFMLLTSFVHNTSSATHFFFAML